MQYRSWITGVLVAAATAACGSDSDRREDPGGAAQIAFEAPAGLRAAYIAAVQERASDAYRVARPERGSPSAPNPAQGFSSELTEQGVRLSTDEEGWSADLSLSRYGCDGDQREIAKGAPEVENNRALYRRSRADGSPALDEWYVNGPLGLEQGFTIPSAPPCRAASADALTIELALGGLDAVTEDGGAAVSLRDTSGAPRLRGTDL
jgi:trimeric autotransporter adhesin